MSRKIFFLTFFLTAIIFPPCLVLADENSAKTPPSASKPIWLVVTRPMFREVIVPLADRRKAEGLETIVSTLPVRNAIAACPRKPSFLLLVGDYQPGQADQSWFVPSITKENYRWSISQPEQFPSDAVWGDLDGDGTVDIPVGRLPARTTAQASLMIEKVIQYETRKPGLPSLVLPIWAGDGQYGELFAKMSTPMLLGILKSHGPAYMQPWIINGARNSPFTGWPTQQATIFNYLLTQTSGLACMIGHGSETTFFSMIFEKYWIGYIAEYARKGLTKPPAGPATIILACYCGDFSQPGECLAESLLLAPGGPAAVIAATAESHPLTNFLTGQAFLENCKPSQAVRRIGPLWLSAVSRAGQTRNILIEKLLTNIEGSIDEEINKPKLFRDQILMHALLGDPAMRLPIPKPLKFTVKLTPKGWQWSAGKPKNATQLIVGLRKAQQLPTVPAKGFLEPSQALETLQAANNTFTFTRQAEIPADLDWTGIIDQPGLLRLLAITPDSIYVATVKLTEKPN